jgi:hypothetical protein
MYLLKVSSNILIAQVTRWEVKILQLAIFSWRVVSNSGCRDDIIFEGGFSEIRNCTIKWDVALRANITEYPLGVSQHTTQGLVQIIYRLAWSIGA